MKKVCKNEKMCGEVCEKVCEVCEVCEKVKCVKELDRIL